MSDYTFVYRNPWGEQITSFTEGDIFRMEYMRKENDYGSLILELPPYFPPGFFKIDGKIEVWRKPAGHNKYLEGNTPFFIRKTIHKTDEQRREVVHILAHDAVQLLDRRLVAYDKGTANSEITDFADDMMKVIIDKNFISDVDTTRNIASTYLTLQPQWGLAPSITKDFAWQKILPLFQDICEQSATKGTNLYFDMVYTSPTAVEFRTFIGQRGIDRGLKSKFPYIVGTDGSGLGYASISFDHTNEATFIYAGGRGPAEDRIFKTAYDNDRISQSPFGRIEDFIDSDNSGLDAVQADADSQLRAKLSKFALNGHIEQGPTSTYGIHYGFGDIIVAQYKGYSVDVHLDTVRIEIADKQETISIFARNLDEAYY
jgi:hypothetical protein